MNYYMRYYSLLLVTALLWASHARGQIANIVNSKPGIAFNANSITVASNYVCKPEDHTILVNAASAAVTVTLPPAGSKGYPFLTVKKIDATANAVTVDGAGAQTIDGAATFVLGSQNQSLTVHANATTWQILAGRLYGDQVLASDASGGNLGAANTLTAALNIKLIPFATMTNGSTETTSWMDDSPAGEFSAVTVGVSPTDTDDATIARIGTNSLKLAWPATSVAGDGVTATLTSDNLEANESVGMWLYVSEALAAGDLTLVLTDDGGARTFNIPAVATANVWTWVEVDVSSLAAGTGDAITAYAIKLSTAGATAHAAFNTYIDTVWKWDAADELALGVDLLDQPGSVASVLTIVKANTGTHDELALVDGTDYFIHRESGNDFLVQITNQSTKAGRALVLHK